MELSVELGGRSMDINCSLVTCFTFVGDLSSELLAAEEEGFGDLVGD